MHASEYNTFEEFARAVHDELPEEWDTNFDDIMMEKVNDQAGYKRDDLYTWMLVLPHDASWPTSEIIAYMPEEIDGIPDRPGVPVHTIETPTVEAVVEFIKETSLDYQGTFTYDD